MVCSCRGQTQKEKKKSNHSHNHRTIPKIPGGIKDYSTCVFRIRYNISTNDYGNDETWGSYMGFDVKEDEGPFDARYNCEKGMNKDAVDYNSADAGDEISCVGAHADGNFRTCSFFLSLSLSLSLSPMITLSFAVLKTNITKIQVLASIDRMWTSSEKALTAHLRLP